MSTPPPASNSKHPVLLDGSHGEGGGQILRTALTISVITGRPFRLTKIRANRPKPGLRPQHLKAVEAAALLCGAKVTGASTESRELTFTPGEFEPKDVSVNIGTAGSTGLVLQTIYLPIAMRAGRQTQVDLLGGTFNPKAPSFFFLAESWNEFLQSFGLQVGLSMPKAGFYPRGGGRLQATIEPAFPKPFNHQARGRLLRVRCIVGLANLPGDIARRMNARAIAFFDERTQFQDCERSIETVDWKSPGQGAVFGLIAEYEGNVPATFVGLGEQGKPAEVVADEAIEQFLAFDSVAEAAVDPHSADQIMLPLAFAEGESHYTVSEVTEHLRTNVSTIRSFLDRSITIEEGDEAGIRGVVRIV